MNYSELSGQILRKKSYLCVGLDTDAAKLPGKWKNRPEEIVAFNRAIIDATRDFAVSYKVNTAFYEQYGTKGWQMMEDTFAALPSDTLRIADAKRGDIGNTSGMYARAFFGNMEVDAVTVAPYMGHDSVQPFLEYKDKWVILLGLTSNPGSADFQELACGDAPLYHQVFSKARQWAGPDQLMFVAGATKADKFEQVRKLAGDHFLLVPGVGAQGGDLATLSMKGFTKDCGLLVNASRAVIYASDGDDFAGAAAREAKLLQQQMEHLMIQAGILS